MVTIDGAKVVVYVYNADGLRVARIEDGVETRHLVDTTHPYAEVVEEYTPAGLVVVRYVHGHDLVAQSRGGATSVYHNDALGSTRAPGC